MELALTGNLECESFPGIPGVQGMGFLHLNSKIYLITSDDRTLTSRMDTDPYEERKEMEGWMDVSQICLCLSVGWYSTVAAVSGKQTQYVGSRWVDGTALYVSAHCTIHQKDCSPQGPPRKACCLASTATYPPDICSCYKYTLEMHANTAGVNRK